MQPPFADDNPLRRAIRRAYHADETACVAHLLAQVAIGDRQRRRIAGIAGQLVEAIRADSHSHGGLDAFLQEYQLSGEEGVALMCLAEALLRIPDPGTADKLIEDRIKNADWKAHIGHSESFLVNMSTWSLLLTGKVIALDRRDDLVAGLIARLARSGEPVIRAAMVRAMKILGKQFVLAEDIHAALRVARVKERRNYRYSYDMLGEAARTDADARRYCDAYLAAINAIGEHAGGDGDPHTSPGISVKLSALHPRYEYAQGGRVMGELLPRILDLCRAAKSFGLGLTIDAEESERLEPSLSVFESLAMDSALGDWDGLGFVVQGYQKRAPAVLDYLQELAAKAKRKIMIRLVKGAYWDREIKHAQVHGIKDYPVFTRKAATDVSYLHCAQKLLAKLARARFFPLFATHNAHTVAAVLTFAEEAGVATDRGEFEFQCLHGMGEALYDRVIAQHHAACRIYAPVGAHKDLLAYLVRRLLENGANSSFVNRLIDRHLPVAQIIRDPVRALEHAEPKPHPNIPPPPELYAGRANSAGMNLFDSDSVGDFYRGVERLRRTQFIANPAAPVGGDKNKPSSPVINPATGETVGMVCHADEQDIQHAVTAAVATTAHWDRIGGDARAGILETAADLMQQHRDELLYLCIAEAGKILADAVAEAREAVDFLRYYAHLARRDFANPQTLPGPTGECNQLQLHGRGVFVCISPWNFPLAIFTGQTAAALAAGNCVLAKPAAQTPLVAARVVEILHQAGVPQTVLHCLPGDGKLGAKLVANSHIAGVAFTGSTATAKRIHRALAQSPGPIRPLIAETGGINAMLVDSTALPEQVTADVITSAFQSAGQRCSAVRILYLQRQVADDIITMLTGAMAELQVGDPMNLATDIGPIITQPARDALRAHVAGCREKGFRVITADDVTANNNAGWFFPPVIIEVGGIKDLAHEVFGPVLHIARFAADELDAVADDINAAGYGLTFGIHSRNRATAARITARIRAGNVYVNRNTIGAVVGAQPFGGEGMSGTGPKAGGPNTLRAFATERAFSTDTTAAGGNASLLSLESSGG